MEKEYFFNNGIPPPLHFPMPNGFQNLNFEKSTEQYPQFESACTTPIDSHFQVPIMNHFLKEKLPNLTNSTHLISVLPAFPNDPGFTERAAKFSCFGSRSFNGRTSEMQLNSAEFQYRSSGISLGNVKLARVASTPSLKIDGSQMGIPEIKNFSKPRMEMRSNNVTVSSSDKKNSNLSGSGANSNEESSVSEQNPSGENGLRTPMELNSRKRRGVSRAKATKEPEGDDNLSLKRSKMDTCNGNKSDVKVEEKPKPPEPPKDYIHVRARRGEATDSHSLAERVRREKISERMKLLQDLVPGCNKVTGKALMLDEIINYVQSLQHQVEFLSMKLATVNPRLDINMDSLLSKNKNGAQICPTDSSSSAYYRHQENPQVVEPIDSALFRNIGMQLDGFSGGISQFSEDDLQSIVEMGFATNQTAHMKIEL